ncbi:MAG: hypothetical protein HGA44_01130 [Cellulomonadaceae bacterium]|nr:hypothetical protein [Cellulomonadaceae bacterium]
MWGGTVPQASTSSPVVVPPVLYVPVRPHPDIGNYPEVRTLADGRLALLAYTALDRLADACGENQPWVLLSVSELGVIKAEHAFDVVAFDPQLPAVLLKDGKLA